MTEEIETLADMLKREQARRGLTDRQAAADVGAKQQTYNSWKRGTEPRPEYHTGIARFLRMKVGKLRIMLAEIKAPIEENREEVKLGAPGSSVLITRRGGGAVVVRSTETGFEIDTSPRLK